MPPPVSDTSTARPSAPGSGRVARVSVPPSGIASRALTARLRIAFSSWLGSTFTRGRFGARSVSRRMREPIVPRRNSAKEAICAFTSVLTGESGWRRAKASSLCVIVAARSAPFTASRRRVRRGLSSGRPRSTRSRLSSTTLSRLLKSWATPPVSWPIASIFWLWRSASSARSRSALAAFRAASASSRSRMRASSASLACRS